MTAIGVRIMSDVRRQLGLPVTWLAVGGFAFLSGWAFLSRLSAFLEHSSQALSVPPLVPVNINQLLIRPYLLEVGLAALVVLPFVTARAQRASSRGAAVGRPPIADGPNGGGTFASVFAVYTLMLLTSVALVAVLFAYGEPEWQTTLCGYLGLLLAGGAYVAVALLLSSLATSALAAGLATMALSMLLATTSWLAWWGTPGVRSVFGHVSVAEGLSDFAGGVVDIGYAVSCLTITALGVGLTRCVFDASRAER